MTDVHPNRRREAMLKLAESQVDATRVEGVASPLGRTTLALVGQIMADAEKIEAIDEAWDMLHFDCSNPDHSEAYRLMAKALGYSK